MGLISPPDTAICSSITFKLKDKWLYKAKNSLTSSKNCNRITNSNLERKKAKKNIWLMVALLSYISAFGFIIAYFIGGYFPYIAIAVMWACIGGLDVILGIHSRRKENDR